MHHATCTTLWTPPSSARAILCSYMLAYIAAWVAKARSQYSMSNTQVVARVRNTSKYTTECHTIHTGRERRQKSSLSIRDGRKKIRNTRRRKTQHDLHHNTQHTTTFHPTPLDTFPIEFLLAGGERSAVAESVGRRTRLGRGRGRRRRATGLRAHAGEHGLHDGTIESLSALC